MTDSKIENEATLVWTSICPVEDIKPDTGVCALVNSEQVAVFRYGSGTTVYAISNYDPFGEANVLSRGITGSLKNRPVVASPLYKQHFDLITGECLEDEAISVKTYPVRVQKGMVEVGTAG
ncbi:MAG: nitrite reductase small subunit NirD [Oleibacter sp.]|nr:nitrite reductase small subunit NirD [Thalassolituus sp.]